MGIKAICFYHQISEATSEFVIPLGKTSTTTSAALNKELNTLF